MTNKRDKDYAWVLFLILAILFFWAAWLARSPEGKLHTALSIWAGVWFILAIVGLIVDLIWTRFRK